MECASVYVDTFPFSAQHPMAAIEALITAAAAAAGTHGNSWQTGQKEQPDRHC